MQTHTDETVLDSTTIDQIARVVFNEDICAMFIAERNDEDIQKRIITDLQKSGVSSKIANEMAPYAMTKLKQAIAKDDQFSTGFVSSFLHKNIIAYRKLVQSYLESNEVLLCVEKTEQLAPFLIRIIPVVGDLAKIGIKHLLIAVTDSRVIVLQLGTSRFKPIVKREVFSIPVKQLDEVVPRRGMFTSSLKLVTHQGKKYQYNNLLKSAAHRLANHIIESLQKQKN